jgi:hypothetical protein
MMTPVHTPTRGEGGFQERRCSIGSRLRERGACPPESGLKNNGAARQEGPIALALPQGEEAQGIGVRGEWERYRISDGSDTDHKFDVDVFGLSVYYKF